MTDVVGLYCRISIDKSGRREGVEAQERWGRAYVAERWPGASVRVFRDNNLSAARGDDRPGYEDLRAAVRAGEITRLWAVEQSRLERQEVGWFELAAELDAAGISELHTRRDGVVRVRDDVAGIKAVINAGEARKIRARVLDKLAENAALGLPHGGTCFGYRRARDASGARTLAIEPEQADALRWAADAVLGGWTLTNIARELTRRGHRGARGGALLTSGVRQLLTAPMVAGLRAHQGEVIGTGNWPPILDEPTWQAVRSRLAGPRSVRTSHGAVLEIPAERIGARPARKYAITGGLARCAVCGAAMGGAMKTLRNGERRPYLSCTRANGGRGCVGIMLDVTEQHATERLLAELDDPRFLAALTADDNGPRRAEIAANLTGIDAQRAELAAMWGNGDLTAAEWRDARASLDRREGTLRAELTAIPAPAARVDIGDVRQAWPGMTLDERREVLRLFIAAIRIHPARPGTRAFDPARVEIVWRTR